jgi:hypothetical protein
VSIDSIGTYNQEDRKQAMVVRGLIRGLGNVANELDVVITKLRNSATSVLE